MPVWCNTCKRHVNAPCVSHRESEEQRRFLCRRFRSTKGASKARRDHINHEIRNMRALLPIDQEDQERLSYLHSMAAICTYIRKSVVLHELQTTRGLRCPLPYEAFLQALHGFILVTTAQGRLVYVSENVSEYLGLSMVDVLQGDTFYDMVEGSDVDVVRSILSVQGEKNSAPERSFVCCMQTSRAFKLQHGNYCSMLVRGGFQSFPSPHPTTSSSSTLAEPLFVALCTPTVNRLSSSGDSIFCQRFSSSHRLDMTFTQLSDSVSYFCGYSAEEMAGRSWYSLVHPEDLSLSANAHRSLMQAEEGLQVEMVLRLQCKDLSWTWIYTKANREFQGISCFNYIISETEARFLQNKISTDAFLPPFVANSCHFTAQQASPSYKGLKRRRTSSTQSEEPGAKARRVSEHDAHYVASASSPVPLGDGSVLFTPPYSPSSSGSPLQQEEPSCDLLMDVQGYADRLLSSPESSPTYYSYPDPVLTCHLSDSLAAPAAEQTFDQRGFVTLGAQSPIRSTSPGGYDLQLYTPDARLVPDRLSAADLCEGLTDCALHQDDLCLLEQPQGGVIYQVHQVPHHSSLLTPSQSPATVYDEREQAEISILAQQISSLASSFDMHRSLGPHGGSLPSPCDWPCHAALPAALPLEPELNDGVFDSILKELDIAVTRKSSTSAPTVPLYSYQPDSQQPEPLGLSPTAPENAMEPLGLQLGCHDQNTGLHQLNHYMQSTLQQDGLAEESLY